MNASRNRNDSQIGSSVGTKSQTLIESLKKNDEFSAAETIYMKV